MAHPTRILLVEDDEGHVTLIKRNLLRAGLSVDIEAADTGREAVHALHAIPPDVILLDLNLPELTGFEVLEFIKSNKDLRHIPVIVLSSTENEEEIKRVYQLGGNLYFTKPVDYDQFAQTIQTLGSLLKLMVV
ncbi:MAG: response regulator [Chloroflexi bacterium]|nr:response regulator [Chloroflexota bacterium]